MRRIDLRVTTTLLLPLAAGCTAESSSLRLLPSDAGSEWPADLPVMAEGVDEAAEEPTVLIVNWPNFVGPCLYCSRKDRERSSTTSTSRRML